MPAYNRPSLKELISTTSSSVLYEMRGIESSLPQMLAKIFSVAIATLAHLLHGHLDFIIDQFFVTTCNNSFLLVHGNIHNITLIPATYTFGNTIALGLDGSKIEANKILISEKGHEYRVLEEVDIFDGSATVQVKSELAGFDYNLDSEEKLSFVESISGVEKTTSIDIDGLSGGLDQETFEQYRERILEIKREIPSGGSEGDYRRWTKESLPGISRVFIQGQKTAPNNVSISYLFDGREEVIPTLQEMTQTQEYISLVRPVTASPVVFALEKQAVDLEIRVTPDTLVVRNAVLAELKDLFTRDSEPEGEMFLSRINEAISLAAGEEDHELESPLDNPIALEGKILTLGDVTWL